jgi:hypothetical protein
MTKGEFRQMWARKIKAEQAKLNALKRQAAKEIEEVEELGGVVSRPEALDFLGVSNPRFSIIQDRFRTWKQLYSLADLKAYKKNRKPGRPKKVASKG